MSVTPENLLAPDLALKASQSRVIHGSCLCGEVGYRISGTPLRMVNCHCESCGSTRSAANASSLFVPARQFQWTRGESQVVSYRLPGPSAFATAFCRRCGGDLPRASRGESVVVVPAGSLDSEPGVQPQGPVRVSARVGWFQPGNDLPQYAEMPPVV
jgi:hypothetical protein